MTNVIGRIDDVVHQRVRLGILTVLDELGECDFNYLLEELELTAGNLSRHLTVLDDAGYVITQKTLEGSRPRTWIRLTQEGQIALQEEIQALRELLKLGGGDE
ncbi:MAG: transcriptional regulator [Actinomycetota bacterium]|nr:transcriptional regulator [Actinomycetota bacterium]